MMIPVAVHAEMGDLLSHFKVYITLQEEYNSNIDLSPNRIKRDDYITTITPGLKFSTSRKSPVTGEFQPTPKAAGRYEVNLDVNGGFNFYAKEHDENYTSLNGNLNAWYALTPRLTFRLRDYITRSDAIRETEYSATSVNGYLPSRTEKRTPYLRNVFEPSLEYQFGKDSLFSINYRNNVYRIDSRTSKDSTENYISPKIIYWFNIRHGVSLEYGLTLGNFERSPDLIGHMGTGRYTYRFNPKTSLFGEYTQLWRDFDSPSVDYTIYRPSLGVEHAITPSLSAKVQGGYYWKDPDLGKTQGGPYFDILITQRGLRTTYVLSLTGGYTEDYFSSENRGFTKYYRVLGRVNHQIAKKMNVGLFSSYEWGKIPEVVIGSEKEINRIWGIGGTASYQFFNWLTVALEASHRGNNSNFDAKDYGEYRGLLKITATF